MLIQILTQHPEAIGQIVRNTPTWVWGLLAALIALGLSQVVSREVSVRRIVVMPVAMLGFAIYGLMSAFGTSGQLVAVTTTWLASALVVGAALVGFGPASSARYVRASRSFQVPGSLLPLALIVGIFLTKYAVGIELAMQPRVSLDPAFALPVALVYGAFNGIFSARAAQLLRLMRDPACAAGTMPAQA